LADRGARPVPSAWAARPAPALSIGVFLLLRDLIADRLGVWFEEEKRELLASKLSDRISSLELRSFLDYYYRLKYGADAEREWPVLTDALSVQETYFWREFDQIRILTEVLIPEHVAAGRGPVRIWSAACATGEEPFTIAIALEEAGWFDRTTIEIWATDISRKALDRAAHGRFRERSFRALPDRIRAKYFTPDGDQWRIAPAIQARVRYSEVNLMDEASTARLASARYVFCRNVFIYFSNPIIDLVVARLASRMPQPGYLFLGVSESLLHRTSAFELVQVNGAFVYRLRAGGVRG
jgi:chemotaxis protein methyltransferase CheR